MRNAFPIIVGISVQPNLRAGTAAPELSPAATADASLEQRHRGRNTLDAIAIKAETGTRLATMPPTSPTSLSDGEGWTEGAASRWQPIGPR
jgi:hypothetical protein